MSVELLFGRPLASRLRTTGPKAALARPSVQLHDEERRFLHGPAKRLSGCLRASKGSRGIMMFVKTAVSFKPGHAGEPIYPELVHCSHTGRRYSMLTNILHQANCIHRLREK